MKKNIILSVLVIMSLMLMVGSVSATINSIEVISPNGGEYLSGTQEIEWTFVGGGGWRYS